MCKRHDQSPAVLRDLRDNLMLCTCSPAPRSLYTDCLVLFYHCTMHDLAGIRPLAKLMCVKAVVFMSFWQGVAIVILVKLGILKGTLNYTVDQVSDGLQVRLEVCACRTRQVFMLRSCCGRTF